jgi:hypothetical protein
MVNLTVTTRGCAMRVYYAAYGSYRTLFFLQMICNVKIHHTRYFIACRVCFLLIPTMCCFVVCVLFYWHIFFLFKLVVCAVFLYNIHFYPQNHATSSCMPSWTMHANTVENLYYIWLDIWCIICIHTFVRYLQLRAVQIRKIHKRRESVDFLDYVFVYSQV